MNVSSKKVIRALIMELCILFSGVFIFKGSAAAPSPNETDTIWTTALTCVIDETETTIVTTTEPTTLPEPEYPISNEEIELIALVTMAEAEGESELGKRLVIDTILNRVDSSRFPDTIEGVIYQPNQFEAMWNGRVDRCYVRDDICELVKEELESRTNEDVVFFQMYDYSPYGNPLFQEGCHYFSSY